MIEETWNKTTKEDFLLSQEDTEIQRLERQSLRSDILHF
jgi:hypothetical protein